MEAGGKLQFLEVIGTKVLANEVIRHLSNLIAQVCWESANAGYTIGGIIEFRSSKHMIITIKCSKRRNGFSMGQLAEVVSELHPGWHENARRPLFIDTNPIRNKGYFTSCKG